MKKVFLFLLVALLSFAAFAQDDDSRLHVRNLELIENDTEAKEKLAYNVELAPAFGWLNITSKPENGATVLINGKRKGVTPYKSDTLASGEYEATVYLDGVRLGETPMVRLSGWNIHL